MLKVRAAACDDERVKKLTPDWNRWTHSRGLFSGYIMDFFFQMVRTVNIIQCTRAG